MKIIALLSSFLLFFAMMILLIVLAPLMVLWSLNTLFPPLAIPYNYQTWAAAVILIGLLHRTYNIKFDKLKK